MGLPECMAVYIVSLVKQKIFLSRSLDSTECPKYLSFRSLCFSRASPFPTQKHTLKVKAIPLCSVIFKALLAFRLCEYPCTIYFHCLGHVSAQGQWESPKSQLAHGYQLAHPPFWEAAPLLGSPAGVQRTEAVMIHYDFSLPHLITGRSRFWSDKLRAQRWPMAISVWVSCGGLRGLKSSSSITKTELVLVQGASSVPARRSL